MIKYNYMSLLGYKHTEEAKNRISKARTGIPLSDAHKQKLKKNHKGFKGLTHSLETRMKLSVARLGENGSNWKGGTTSLNKTLRRGIEFRLWREAVFARDNWTCQECKERGGELHPHHIKPFAFFPELRFAIDNGVTLCRKCHQNTPTYGGGARAYQSMFNKQ